MPSWATGSRGLQVGDEMRGSLGPFEPCPSAGAWGHGPDAQAHSILLRPPNMALTPNSPPASQTAGRVGAKSRGQGHRGAATGLAFFPLAPWPQACTAQPCPGHKPLLPAAPEPTG